MVGDDTGYFAVDVLAAPAIEQIRQAMGLLAHQQDDAFGDAFVDDAPVHFELSGNGGELPAKPIETEWQ